MIEYQARCMERLIPKVHLPRMESVRVERGWLERLRDLKDAERPPERRAKDQIDVTRRKGVLATDLVGGDTIAVEIKVRWTALRASYAAEKNAAKVGVLAIPKASL